MLGWRWGRAWVALLVYFRECWEAERDVGGYGLGVCRVKVEEDEAFDRK